MEGDRDIKEDGDCEGDGDGEGDGDEEGQVEMGREMWTWETEIAQRMEKERLGNLNMNQRWVFLRQYIY
jgi:hypothetical protein